MANSFSDLLQSEHQRIEKIIKAIDVKENPGVVMHLVKASNSMRHAAETMKEDEEKEEAAS